MNSIQKKLSIMVTISIIAITAFLIVVNTMFISQDSDYNSSLILNETCAAQAMMINSKLGVIEQAVTDMKALSVDRITSREQLYDPEFVNDFVEEFKQQTKSIASVTDCAVAVYCRINPEIVGSGTVGFFTVHDNVQDKFLDEPPTDILAYEKTDLEHVGWYYQPIFEGAPLWMAPYHNENIDVVMISYVIPIYINHEEVGVVGMDVEFDTILNIAEDIDIYENARGCLFSEDCTTSYRTRDTLFDESIPAELALALTDGDTTNGLLKYDDNNVSYKLSYSTLRNGMKFVLYAPEKDINYNRDRLIKIGVISGVTFAFFVALMTILMTGKIVKPIRQITAITRAYAKGDWDATIDCRSGDELEDLSESINSMAENTKKQLQRINNMAYVDALTGIRNRTAYLQYISMFNKEMTTRPRDFAIVMMDLNGLKAVNDTLGHEEGDKFIKAGATLICNHFKRSPVFRMGGDEFICIVNGQDYYSCHELEMEFHSKMRKVIAKEGPDAMTIACGVAYSWEIDPMDPDVMRVEKNGTKLELAEMRFNKMCLLADTRMYENKAELKNENI